MGQHKKPTALKVLHGTDHRNKQRQNPDEPEANGLPDPSPTMSAGELACWNEIIGLVWDGVLSRSDSLALEIMARLLFEYRTNPADFQATKLKQLESFLARFGMTPADRTKIVLPRKAPSNPYEDM